MKLSAEESNNITVNIDKLVEDINTNFLPVIPSLIPGYKVDTKLTWNHDINEPKFTSTLKSDEASKALVLAQSPILLPQDTAILTLYKHATAPNQFEIRAMIYNSDSFDSFENTSYPKSLGLKIGFIYMDPRILNNTSNEHNLSEFIADFFFDENASNNQIDNSIVNILSSAVNQSDPDLKFQSISECDYGYKVKFLNRTERYLLLIYLDPDNLKYKIELEYSYLYTTSNSGISLKNISDIINIFKQQIGKYLKIKENLDKKYSIVSNHLDNILGPSSDIVQLDTLDEAQQKGVFRYAPRSATENPEIIDYCEEHKINFTAPICPTSFLDESYGYTPGKLLYDVSNDYEFFETPKDTKKIDADAFYDNSKLVSVKLNDGLKIIGEAAFAYCKKLKSINIPDTVIRISPKAFYYCDNLENVYISKNVKKIEYETFCNCPSLKYINLPEGLVSIEEYAFASCSDLRDIIISASVETIDMGAFFNCPQLRNVTLGNKIKYIGSNSFAELPGTDKNINLTIHSNNPYVIQYCQEHEINWQLLSEESISLIDDLDEFLENRQK